MSLRPDDRLPPLDPLPLRTIEFLPLERLLEVRRDLGRLPRGPRASARAGRSVAECHASRARSLRTARRKRHRTRLMLILSASGQLLPRNFLVQTTEGRPRRGQGGGVSGL